MRKNTFVMTVAMLMGTMALGCAGSAFAAGTTLESATKTALEAAGVAESDVIFEKKGTSFDDGREIYEIDFFVPGQMKYDFDIDTTTGAIVGLTEADVVFTKCVKDVDDGIVKFEIDFRAKDGMEYEYDFRLADGTLLDKNVDMDDWDD